MSNTYNGLGLVNELCNLRLALGRRDDLASALRKAESDVRANELAIEKFKLRLGAHVHEVGHPEIVDIDDGWRAFVSLPSSLFSLSASDGPKAEVTFCPRRDAST
jgi:hypothetical protein